MSSVLNDDIDYEPLYEGFIAKLKNLGIEIEVKDIHWRGFSSQGDGMCFDFALTTLVDVKNFLKNIEFPGFVEFERCFRALDAFDIITSKNCFSASYCHEKTRNIDIIVQVSEINQDLPFDTKLNIQKKIEELPKWEKEVQEFVAAWYIDTCQEFYNLLEAHYNEEREYDEEDDLEREEWDEEMTISDRIDAMIDPEMNIEKVVQMVMETKVVSNSKGEEAELLLKFIENFNNEYLIIKKGY